MQTRVLYHVLRVCLGLGEVLGGAGVAQVRTHGQIHFCEHALGGPARGHAFHLGGGGQGGCRILQVVHDKPVHVFLTVAVQRCVHHLQVVLYYRHGIPVLCQEVVRHCTHTARLCHALYDGVFAKVVLAGGGGHVIDDVIGKRYHSVQSLPALRQICVVGAEGSVVELTLLVIVVEHVSRQFVTCHPHERHGEVTPRLGGVERIAVLLYGTLRGVEIVCGQRVLGFVVQKVATGKTHARHQQGCCEQADIFSMVISHNGSICQG